MPSESRQMERELRDVFGLKMKLIPHCLLQPLPMRHQRVERLRSRALSLRDGGGNSGRVGGLAKVLSAEEKAVESDLKLLQSVRKSEIGGGQQRMRDFDENWEETGRCPSELAAAELQHLAEGRPEAVAEAETEIQEKVVDCCPREQCGGTKEENSLHGASACQEEGVEQGDVLEDVADCADETEADAEVPVEEVSCAEGDAGVHQPQESFACDVTSEPSVSINDDIVEHIEEDAGDVTDVTEPPFESSVRPETTGTPEEPKESAQCCRSLAENPKEEEIEEPLEQCNQWPRPQSELEVTSLEKEPTAEATIPTPEPETSTNGDVIAQQKTEVTSAESETLSGKDVSAEGISEDLIGNGRCTPTAKQLKESPETVQVHMRTTEQLMEILKIYQPNSNGQDSSIPNSQSQSKKAQKLKELAQVLKGNIQQIYDQPPTAEEIHEFAEYLGMDVEKDQELLYIAEWAMTAPLPPDWSVHLDSAGNEYFYNTASKTSSYEHPMDQFYRELYQSLRQVT